MDLAVDVPFADAARDELRVLRAVVEDQDPVAGDWTGAVGKGSGAVTPVPRFVRIEDRSERPLGREGGSPDVDGRERGRVYSIR